MTVEHVNPDTLPRHPGFSQVVVAPPGRLAFIAEQGAFTEPRRRPPRSSRG